jgi:hypothetical protein
MVAGAGLPASTPESGLPLEPLLELLLELELELEPPLLVEPPPLLPPPSGAPLDDAVGSTGTGVGEEVSEQCASNANVTTGKQVARRYRFKSNSKGKGMGGILAAHGVMRALRRPLEVPWRL